MKKLFNNIKMSWKNLIIFAVISGIYTGLVMCIPFLKNTSFQDIGISYECWVLFALIVVCNCKKWYEAVIKCFIYFLISQPLVYLTEVLLGHLSLNMGVYYYTRIWLPITMLTIPGGYIAYFSKKQNLIGSIILGLGNTILIFMGYYYLMTTINNFPYHLITFIYCIVSIIFITLGIQNKKKYRIISFIIPVVLLIVGIIVAKMMGLYLY